MSSHDDPRAAARIEATARHLEAGRCAASRFPISLPVVKNDTCGIIAYVGTEDCVPYLLEGLNILENRGYDSAGITTIDKGTGELVTTKFASVGTTSDALQRLKQNSGAHTGHTSGIAHTRWATHGGKTDTNAHPHLDYKNRVSIVHNGVIQNYDSLRAELEKTGIKFKSQCDSEVIAQLIGHYLDCGMGVVEAAQKTHQRLVGTWGVVVIAKDLPGKLIAMKNGSPLLVGLSDKHKFVASEPAAFARHTRQFIPLQDMEFAVLGGDASSLDLSRVETHHEDNIVLTPDPWPHWTIKEIMEQPVSLSLALNYGGRFLDDSHVKLGGLEAKRAQLVPIHHIVIAACGTSLFAGMYGAALMRHLGSVETVQAIDAAEIQMEQIPKQGAGMLVISQSGETKDVHRAVLLAAELNVPTFSVINVVGSLIARTTGCGLYINAGREVAVASTKAFTSQVCCLALAAVWFSQQREAAGGRLTKQRELIDALHRLPTNVGVALSARQKCRDIARRIVESNSRSLFVLGKGMAEPVAREGALKIKEITYLHAEGYSGGALKHGPFALIEKGTPIILIILDDSQAAFMDIAAAEVRARGAYTVVITDNAKKLTNSHNSDDVIEIPGNGLLTALIAIVPIQMIAYEASVLRGINPDRPRNLAKAVTVD